MIEKLAHLVDIIKKPKGNISKKGFLKGKWSNEILRHLPFKSSLPKVGTKQIVFDESIGSNIINAFFAKNNNIRQDILDYQCDPEFDICYYFGTYNNEKKAHRNSQLWHHDSVGHRLKLFIALESGWTTYFLEQSHSNSNIFNSSLSKRKELR